SNRALSRSCSERCRHCRYCSDFARYPICNRISGLSTGSSNEPPERHRGRLEECRRVPCCSKPARLPARLQAPLSISCSFEDSPKSLRNRPACEEQRPYSSASPRSHPCFPTLRRSPSSFGSILKLVCNRLSHDKEALCCRVKKLYRLCRPSLPSMPELFENSREPRRIRSSENGSFLCR